MKPRHVKTGEIAVGKPLAASIYDDDGQLLLKKGYIITPKDVQKSMGAIIFEYEPHEVPAVAEDTDEYTKLDEMQEAESPFEQLALLQFRLNALFKNIEKEKMFQSKVRVLAALIEDICKNDEDLALATIMLDTQARYSIRHHMHTAIVCNVIAKRLGWDLGQRTSLVMAALTMNIGMLELQDQLHFQVEPISAAQAAELRAHPIAGMEMIQSLGVTDELWCNTILQHHEVPDGSGYPNNLRDKQITQAARILSLCDTYCARVSGRDYRPPLSPNLAMKAIFLNTQIDTDLGMLFIKHLGIFPPGTYVRLKNNEIAIVTQRGLKINCPIVRTVIRGSGTIAFVPPRRDTSQAEYTVTALVAADKVGIEINRYQLWGYGAFKRAKSKGQDNKPSIGIPAKILDLRTISTMDATIIDINENGCTLKISPDDAGSVKIGMSLHLTFKILKYVVENAAALVKNLHQRPYALFAEMQFTDLSDANRSNIRAFIKLHTQST
ncbi:MAG: HD domain-containing protein [Candidatus Magnetominusculus sp. LBB02]|nr:HD domain-containing protein [Candidatus Magnetominusculus sp. LBB02]